MTDKKKKIYVLDTSVILFSHDSSKLVNQAIVCEEKIITLNLCMVLNLLMKNLFKY